MRRPLTNDGSIFSRLNIGYACKYPGHVGFSFFPNNFGKYNALYGSIGTVIAPRWLLFILICQVLLIGYELNVSIHSLANWQERQKHEAEAAVVLPTGG